MPSFGPILVIATGPMDGTVILEVRDIEVLGHRHDQSSRDYFFASCEHAAVACQGG